VAVLETMPESIRSHLINLDCPSFETSPWVQGPVLNKQRVAILSTAGLHKREDRPFTFDPGDHYRVIPNDIKANDLVMSHLSTNFDRSGFQQDLNVVFPRDRLNELAKQNIIGSVATYHYSFMGGTDPRQMEPSVKDITAVLKEDRVNAVLLIPV